MTIDRVPRAGRGPRRRAVADASPAASRGASAARADFQSVTAPIGIKLLFRARTSVVRKFGYYEVDRRAIQRFQIV
jgi:hypothetical protein